MKTIKVILLILVLLGITAAGLYIHRVKRAKSAQPCWNHLAQIQGAKEQWAIDNSATSGTPVTAERIEPYLKVMPTCHVDGATYVIGPVGKEVECTFHDTLSHYKEDRQ